MTLPALSHHNPYSHETSVVGTSSGSASDLPIRSSVPQESTSANTGSGSPSLLPMDSLTSIGPLPAVFHLPPITLSALHQSGSAATDTSIQQVSTQIFSRRDGSPSSHKEEATVFCQIEMKVGVDLSEQMAKILLFMHHILNLQKVDPRASKADMKLANECVTTFTSSHDQTVRMSDSIEKNCDRTDNLEFFIAAAEADRMMSNQDGCEKVIQLCFRDLFLLLQCELPESNVKRNVLNILENQSLVLASQSCFSTAYFLYELMEFCEEMLEVSLVSYKLVPYFIRALEKSMVKCVKDEKSWQKFPLMLRNVSRSQKVFDDLCIADKNFGMINFEIEQLIVNCNQLLNSVLGIEDEKLFLKEYCSKCLFIEAEMKEFFRLLCKRNVGSKESKTQMGSGSRISHDSEAASEGTYAMTKEARKMRNKNRCSALHVAGAVLMPSIKDIYNLIVEVEKKLNETQFEEYVTSDFKIRLSDIFLRLLKRNQLSIHDAKHSSELSARVTARSAVHFSSSQTFYQCLFRLKQLGFECNGYVENVFAVYIHPESQFAIEIDMAEDVETRAVEKRVDSSETRTYNVSYLSDMAVYSFNAILRLHFAFMAVTRSA